MVTALFYNRKRPRKSVGTGDVRCAPRAKPAEPAPATTAIGVRSVAAPVSDLGWMSRSAARIARYKMAIYNGHMDISITEFKQRCLAIIRSLEKNRKTVIITRRGRPVAQLEPPILPGTSSHKPWENLRSRGGKLLAAADESVLRDKDFKALR